MTQIIVVEKAEFLAILDRRFDLAIQRNIANIKSGTTSQDKAIDDMFDELNKVKRELISLKDYVKLLSKDIDALNFAVRRFTDKQPQDTICKADVPQDVIKKPRTGTATTSDGIYFKDVNPDR